MASSFEGKSVIVTGAGYGVGLAIARRFAESGARVMFAGRDEEKLEKEVTLLEGEAPGAVQYYAGDISQKLEVANLMAATLDAYDRVDILVNAHRDLQSSDPLNPDCTAFEELYTTNVLTPLRLSKTFASRLIQQAEGTDEDTPAGAIVNVTSIASRLTLPDLVAYSVAAAAVDQMTRSLAVAYAKYRIRVNAIALGSVMSSSLQSALKDDGSLHEELRAATPLGRIGEADEAAEVAMFLASQAASFVTGQIVAVDGGRTMLDSLDTPAH